VQMSPQKWVTDGKGASNHACGWPGHYLLHALSAPAPLEAYMYQGCGLWVEDRKGAAHATHPEGRALMCSSPAGIIMHGRFNEHESIVTTICGAVEADVCIASNW
jgi:hypothetical protein